MASFIAGVLVAAFAYFIYTRVEKARNKDGKPASGGGGGRGDDDQTHVK